jgi:RNA polymerase-binding transcription factor DksA
MTALDLHAYRRQLTGLAADLSGKLADLRVEALRPTGTETAGGSAATADGEASGETAALALLGTEEDLLAQVNAAIQRLDRGTFGRCEGCGRPIAKARLDALPYASRCVRCARTAEVEGGI